MSCTILNLDTITPQPLPAGLAAPAGTARPYGALVGMIGAQISARQLGCNLVVLPPGQHAFPFHNHRNNEEMFLVLAGEGEIRLGTERHALRAGDMLACPAGGPETAHQIRNTGSGDLRYLVFGTRQAPDVIEYPDSGKFRVMTGTPGEGGFDAVVRSGSEVDYWAGE
ncbi:auxin-binding protein [Jeongeupia sp. HS-3]|uniref:cupin domain-containing protein n=1 Tax=Jeongeupia sp. HS-3 TaxID=1009682 RepID=UPI0018A3E072|nr:cupin domain-containing protein [Jeongeupia sp. HS-3]BCL77039.1 auxin-binding protein [Jeongeupia sp. HS-3]